MIRAYLTLLLGMFLCLPVLGQSSADRGWSYGLYGGAGVAVPTGSLADNYKPHAAFVAGASLSHDRVTLKADVDFGQPSMKNKNIFGAVDPVTAKPLQLNSTADASLFGISAQLGYKVFRSRSLCVTPNAGVHMSRYSWDVNHVKWDVDDQGNDVFTVESAEGKHLSHWGLMASVDIDITLHSALRQEPLFGGDTPERFISALRITPFVAQVSHSSANPSVKGCLVGVTVNYLGLFSRLDF